MEACLEAQKAGKLRFIGFTGHKDPRIHRDMLEDAKQHNFRFDTVQIPVTVRSCCAKARRGKSRASSAVAFPAACSISRLRSGTRDEDD